MLAWTPVRGATYYNVQLFHGGGKVLSMWPAHARLQLPRAWRFKGHHYRLRPGRYAGSSGRASASAAPGATVTGSARVRSSCADAAGATDAHDLAQMGDVLRVGRIRARPAAEPGVEDLFELGLRGRAEAEREHVGVVPAPRPLGGLSIAAQRGPDARHLVGRDRGFGPCPARDDRLFGPAVGHVASSRLARPGPVGTFPIGVGAVQHGFMPAPAKLIGQRLRDAGQLVGRDAQSASNGGQTARHGRVQRPARARRRPPPRSQRRWRMRAEPLSPYARMSSISGTQRAALVGERVLDARRHLGKGLTLDDPLFFQRTQAQRQRARADALQRALELAEARAALGEVADDEERPLAADDLCRPADRTRVIGSHRSRF